MGLEMIHKSEMLLSRGEGEEETPDRRAHFLVSLTACPTGVIKNRTRFLCAEKEA